MRLKRKIFTLILSVFSVLFGVFAFGSFSANAEDTPVSEFKINNGASIRLASSQEIALGTPVNGVRFSAYLTEAYHEALLTQYPNAEAITLHSSISKVVAESETSPAPFLYQWDIATVNFNSDGVATFYHTIKFDSLTGDNLKVANAFDMQADFWIEVAEENSSEAMVVKADNADTVDVKRSMRQVAYMAYTTPSTQENPNPAYQDTRLKNYFALGETSESVYDTKVKTKELSTIAPENVTAENVYVVTDDSIADATEKTLADVFTTEEASVGSTKTLVFFDADNTAYPVQTRYVTQIINTVDEATAFFTTGSNTTQAAAMTGYYLLTEDLEITANKWAVRWFTNGTFDGDGHTLTVSMGENQYDGLFGRISNVTIKDIQFNIAKDFSPRTSNQKNVAAILAYQTSSCSECLFENVQLNLSRAEGDTDENYIASAYPSLWITGDKEKSTANNVIITIADGTLIFSGYTLKSITLNGFATTENCYMFSEQYSLMKANDASWGTFGRSISSAISSGETFTPLTESKFWTLDKVNATLTFGKVIEEEPEDEPTDNPTDTPDVPTEGEFNPVVRFAVTSDVHIRRYDLMDGVDQLEKVYTSAYNFSSDETLNDGYTKLDGVFVVGDLTNYEVDYEYPLFFDAVESNTREGTLSRSVMGNHEYSKIVYSNTDGWANTDNIDTAINKFLEASGYESEDYHTVLNGYHFIFVSMDRYGKSSGTANEYISSDKLAWLEEQLETALADDPTGTKPIFVFQHVHVQNTVAGSSNSDKYLRELLDKYPNVVDFSGHTHRPVSDPRSIWQETFTAINTGSMAYLNNPVLGAGVVAESINKNGEWSQSEAEHAQRDGGLYYICEVNADNVMRIFVYDTFTDSVFGAPIYVDSFGDPAGFDYTSDRETNSVAPEFKETDQITVTNNSFNRTDIIFPQATGKDVVANYSIEIYQNGELVKTEYRLSGSQYANAMPETMNVTIAGLVPSTTYTLKVYAYNFWSKISEPLVKEFTTADMPTTISPDILSISFNETGAVDTLGGAVVKKNNASVALDETLNKYIGVFDGNAAYNAKNLSDWFTTMKSGFTVETYVKITEAPASGKKYALLANNDDGGFGLYYTSDGNYQFSCCCNNEAFATASAAGNINEWVHVVGVYDTTSLKLYLNGELVATTSVSGKYMPPRLLSNFLMIGADPYYVNESMEYPSKSNIATVNMYGYALTDEQVQQIYQTK